MANVFRGLARLPKEHFTVYLGAQGQNVFQPISSSPWSYYADPFVWRHQGQTWLLVEEFEYLKNRGRLRCIPFDEKGLPGTPQALIHLDCHASFPFLFENSGQLYMVPETSQGGYIDLFLCEDFPASWRRLTRLMDGVDAADTVVFEHESRWWMFTSMRADRRKESRWLAIYFCDDIFNPDWRMHPFTRTKQFAGSRYSTGRNAGAVIQSGGKLLRLAQHNPNYYGESVRVMQIETLTPMEFVETPSAVTNTVTEITQHYSPHHVSMHEDFVAFDVRDRVSYLQWFSKRHQPARAGGAQG
jgi:hypothetical protein